MATMTVAEARQVGTMKVAQVSGPGKDFEIVERAIPEPAAGQVRVAARGGHKSASRACRRRHNICVGSRSVAGAAACSSGTWQATKRRSGKPIPIGRTGTPSTC